MIYLDSVRDAAQVRLDLALGVLEDAGFEVTGEIGDSDPFSATMDAIGERKPDEIVISTLPPVASGWLRRDLVERVADASGIPVQHVISEIDEDAEPRERHDARGRQPHRRRAPSSRAGSPRSRPRAAASTSSSSSSRRSAATASRRPRPRTRPRLRSSPACARPASSSPASSATPTPSPRR